MSLLTQQPDILLLPNAKKAGKLYSVLPTDGSGDFTVSRNGSATYMGKDGLIKTAGPNEPRLEFNPDGTFKGLLVEPSATNLLLRSETFISGGWVYNESYSEPNATIAPNGQLGVTRLISNPIPALWGLTWGGSGILDNTTYTFSIWVKSNTGMSQNFRLVVSSSFISEDLTCTNEWQRFEFTATRNTSGTRYGIVRDSLDSSGDLLIWGAQLEVGSAATSYIPTEASTVTRPADVIQKTNAQDLIGQEEGSFYVHFDRHLLTPSFENLLTLFSTGLNEIWLSTGNNSSTDTLIFSILRNGVVNKSLATTSLTEFNNKIVSTYSVLDSKLKLFLNGIKIAENTLMLNQMPDNILSQVHIGNRASTRQWGKPIKSVALFKRALTDAEAIALTTL